MHKCRFDPFIRFKNTAQAEAPGLSEARGEAEAVPVESIAPVAEIDEYLVYIVNKKKTGDNFKFL